MSQIKALIPNIYVLSRCHVLKFVACCREWVSCVGKHKCEGYCYRFGWIGFFFYSSVCYRMVAVR
jgi:hypothetical protein